MKMLHRFVLLALVVAAFMQPAFAAQPTVEFELDNSTNPSAYEETLPTGDAEQTPVINAAPEPAKAVAPAARSIKKPAAKPAKVAPEPAPEPRDIPLIETINDVIVSPEIRYVTGGVGEDEERDIIASKPNYNLYVMSANETGNFMGDARVVIARKQGEAMEIVLDVVSGPLLYVALPVGTYTLSASLGAQSKRVNFKIKEKGTPPNIHLGWKTSGAH